MSSQDGHDWHDVAQICLNGHVANSETKERPDASRPFCSECGAATITECPNCRTEIEGEYHMEGVVDFTEFKPPAFCPACGKPYPWTLPKSSEPGASAKKGSPGDSRAIGSSAVAQTPRYDCFICHASEDKECFVDTLARRLRGAGCEVWYDDFVLKVGDSLRRSIDEGLRRSRHGVVVLSPRFFIKDWPQRELDGLAALAQERGILPVWLDVDKADVTRFSPMLADILAVRASDGIEAVANKLLDAMGRVPTPAHSAADSDTSRSPKSAQSASDAPSSSRRGTRSARSVPTGAERRPSHPPGSIGANLSKKGYVDHLIERYHEFRKVDSSYGRQVSYSYGVIHRNIQRRFGGKTFFLPEGLFDDLTSYLKDRIDQTIQGRRNKAGGTPNFSSYENYCAEHGFAQ